MDPVVVVGAGISGVACARTLLAAGLPVVVLDRGRRVGGRMAVRTHQGRPVDIGASYLTASDPGFEAVVEDWRARGLARPWTDSFTVHEAGSPDRTGPAPARSGGAPPGACAPSSRTSRPVCTSCSSRSRGSARAGARLRPRAGPHGGVGPAPLGRARRRLRARGRRPVLRRRRRTPPGGRRPVLVAHCTTAMAARHLEAPHEATAPLLGGCDARSPSTRRPTGRTCTAGPSPDRQVHAMSRTC